MSIVSERHCKVRKLTTRVLCERYGVSERTVDWWTATGILPQPMRINNVRYWDEAEIEQRERDHMSAGRQPERVA